MNARKGISRIVIGGRQVSRPLWQAVLLSTLAMTVCVAQDTVSIIHGTIKKTDKAARTLVVRAGDGAEHTIKVTEQTAIHGTKDGFEGLGEGSEVVVRSMGTGRQTTADDIGKISKDGMKIMEGTIQELDRRTNTVTVKDADGAEKTFEYTDHAANDLDKVVVRGAEKGARVTVYYTEDGIKKIAYFLASGHRSSRPNPLATSANGRATLFPSIHI